MQGRHIWMGDKNTFTETYTRSTYSDSYMSEQWNQVFQSEVI